MGKQWKYKEDKFLISMRNAGISYKEIAQPLGRTAGSCQQRAFKLGICKPHRKAPPERQLEMDLQVAPATKTEFRESPKKQIEPSKPKPTWWSAMMWWRK